MNARDLPDVKAFVETLNTLDRHPLPEVRRLFDAGAELVVTRAPGRLDLMGGIADYSGSLVLELPLAEATLVALQRDPAARSLRIVSLTEEGARSCEMALAAFERDGAPVSYAEARAAFQRETAQHWAAYVAGLFLVLMRERGTRFGEGARLLIRSDVPEGKGVSSSAALEVAVMSAVAAAFELQIEPREIALLCQKAENLVAGAPCGVMDQMTAACGERGRLLALLCQPASLRGTLTLPADLAIWGIDSGVRHSIGGGDYGSVRAGAFMGYRMIAEAAGRPARLSADGRTVRVEDARWGGYLANITPAEFESSFAALLPERLTGADFLARYQGTTDPVTSIEPARSYAVRQPTAHPIYEHFRVRLFAELLQGPVNERRLELLGELMFQSHLSYSACGLGSPGTDRLVELVREAGPAAGFYGAKITGGGSGGTVAVLGRAGAHIGQLAERYAQEEEKETGGCAPQIFAGSSPGAAEFGALKLTLPAWPAPAL